MHPKVASAVAEMVVARPEIGSLIVDVLSLSDLETMSKKEERERFLGILNESEKYLPERTLKERMEIESLGEAGVVKNHKKFFQTIIKLKTKMFYKQQKYNLFREESEGYAKLVTELNQDLTTVTPVEVMKVIKSIIGFFNLDPNRVLDIILESFECQLHMHGFYVELLRLYAPDRYGSLRLK